MYITGRNTRPYQPIQCLAVTASIGQRIQLTCTSVFSLPTSSVTVRIPIIQFCILLMWTFHCEVHFFKFQKIYDSNGKNVIADPPVAGRTYTTGDNTLIIKSMASGSDNKKDRLHCEWESTNSSLNLKSVDSNQFGNTFLMLTQ